MIKAIIFDLDDTIYPVHVKTINTMKVKPLLERLKKRYKLIVLSNGLRFKIKERIAKAGYDNLFTKVYNPNFIINRKPFPGKIYKILKELNITKNEVVIVGDKIHTDILVAKIVGIKSILVTNGNKKFNFVKPDYKVNSVLDLERVLEKL